MKLPFFIFMFFWIFFTQPLVFAKENNINCDNRYLTLVNPVRGRNLWFDKNLKSIKDQYTIIKSYNYSATWLLQYDVLSDSKLLQEIKNFDGKQEKGVFLEVSKNWADQSRVIYPYDAPWFAPRAVFLSGYSQSERRRLIDELFARFKNSFGLYPEAVGSWWIDSYSLNYLQEKYHIKIALIVANQKTTDNYGVWGQWWGVPYYPSKANILTPANSLKNKQDVVIIQWAQRDPLLAVGEGADYSNYSLQANDYIRQGKDTSYFKDLINIYLDCQNPIGQATVGLETGIESLDYLFEYKNQLEALKDMRDLHAVTMSQFAQAFGGVYPDFPQKIILGKPDGVWNLEPNSRSNTKLKDFIKYDPNVSFKDYFLADKSNFLERKLPLQGRENNLSAQFPWYLLVILGFGLMAYRKKMIKVWMIATLFAWAAFGLHLRSMFENGWQIFYGAVLPNMPLVQIGLIIFSIALVWFFYRFLKNSLYLWLLPLSFGADSLVQSLRFTFVSGKYYLGFATDALHFVGLRFSKPFNLSFVNQDFPAYQAAALLRFDFGKIWDNLWLSLVIYPLGHVILALILGFILLRFPKKARRVMIAILLVLFLVHLVNIFTADPRFVTIN